MSDKIYILILAKECGCCISRSRAEGGGKTIEIEFCDTHATYSSVQDFITELVAQFQEDLDE